MSALSPKRTFVSALSIATGHMCSGARAQVLTGLPRQVLMRGLWKSHGAARRASKGTSRINQSAQEPDLVAGIPQSYAADLVGGLSFGSSSLTNQTAIVESAWLL